jgi:hypothetical protein
MSKALFLLLLCLLSFNTFNYAQEPQKNNPFPPVPEQQPAGKQNENISFPKSDQYKNSKLTYKLIPAANKTWCYDILAEGRMMIHQPSAPGLPGNEGFKSKDKAAKVAELVISKIKNGEMPPSITLEEMKKLGAL